MPEYRILDDADRPSIFDHLQRLSADDRQRRFGTKIKDPGLAAYARRLDLAAGRITGCFEAGRLIGLAEVFPLDAGAEAAFSVDAHWRCQGIGTALVARALEVCRRGRHSPMILYIQACNRPMQRVARKTGFRLSLEDGETVARHALAGLPVAA
jgi:GNAT superfamily N-acetyltransferase